MKNLAVPLFAITLSLAFGRTSVAADEPKTSAGGISRIAAEPVVRVRAAGAPGEKIWLYQVALPLQISSTQGALFCNVREGLAQGVDFEAGNDVIVFGSVAEIGTATPVAANRNHVEPNPNTMPPGQPATMVKYPIRGGFVPLGAKGPDGKSRPHAGTGFGLSLAQAWKTLADGPPPYRQNSYADAESYRYWELQQFAFDGQDFRVTATERIPIDKLVPGWSVSNGGMTNAVADGDDLLVAMVGKSRQPGGAEGSAGRRFLGSGIVRFRREAGRWGAVSFDPITPLPSTSEPSLVRDVDGALLATARGGDPERVHDVRIARSNDGGRTWAEFVTAPGIISVAPVSINRGADGTPYVAANLHAVTPGPQDRLTLEAAARKVPVEAGMNSRNTLCLWPLAADRKRLAAPLTVLDCRAEFGPPVGGSRWNWRIDHPSGMTVRLADGRWHHLLGARVQDYREIKEAMPPTPRTGMYVYEVFSDGPPRPTWDF